ncbi:hypothetical protein [uncultured Winogradskyella sp.]|uniref:hypothetical protein n=1 Tax=uncultured Winogradskyella sp. TaxID=395353 RepID=UPI00261C4126|nr:hypothetical protein [uncultured Winogradskyella sp.]
MYSKNIKGKFNVIESFAIRSKDEFYLIGSLTEGEIQKEWFVNVVLNSSLSLTLRIFNIDEIEISGEEEKYKLLSISGDNETLDILLGLNIGNEDVNITLEGSD